MTLMSRLPSSLWIVVLMSLALAACPSAKAQDDAADEAPPVVDDRKPVPQAHEVSTLDNGARVLVQPIEGIESVAILVTLTQGSDHDPRNAAGLSDVLAHLAMHAAIDDEAVSTHELPEDRLEPRTDLELRRAYGDGWRAVSYPDHISFGWTVAPEDAALHVREAISRVTSLSITQADVERAIDAVDNDTKEKFIEKLPLAPRAWAEVLAFPHTSRATYGTDAGQLRRMRRDDIIKAWNDAAAPSNVVITITGNIQLSTRALLIDLAKAMPSDGSSNSSSTAAADTITRKPVGRTGRKVAVDNLPGGREHVAVVLFAPALDHPDHPAFLVVAEMLTMSALQMPASKARLAFEYTLLEDPRAAYLTPHTAQYPRGAGQALGYWFVKIQNLRPSRSRARRTRKSLGWQLGDPIIPIVLDLANERPSMHLDIAHGVVFRELNGGAGFWDEYRARLIKQDPREMARVRTEYFTNQGWAFFWLQSQAPPPDRERQRRQR